MAFHIKATGYGGERCNYYHYRHLFEHLARRCLSSVFRSIGNSQSIWAWWCFDGCSDCRSPKGNCHSLLPSVLISVQIFNIGFATCGIVGAVYGMGKTPAYLAHHQEDLRRGLLVSVPKILKILFHYLSAIMRKVLVARADPLRIHLHNRQDIYCHNSASAYDWSYSLVHFVRVSYLFNRYRDCFLILHHFSMPSSRLLLEPLSRNWPLPRHQHPPRHRLYV